MALGEAPQAEQSARDRGSLWLLLGLVALAVGLRFFRLGDWGFEATEIFTRRDSIVEPRWGNARPVIYFLNYYVVRPLVPLDEFGLRLLPAIFGVLAVPALFLVTRRLAGTRTALFSAFLVAISSIQVYYSQYARYWTLVFLLCSIYPFALYLGMRDRSARWLAWGLITAVLAALSHPVSVLLFGALGVWIAVTYLRRARLAELWSQRGVRWGAIIGLVVVGVLVLRFIPILQSWISMHDAGRQGEFLLHLPVGPGIKQASYILSYTEALTAPVVLTGLTGIYFLWLRGNRSLAVLLACIAVLPAAFLILLSLRTPISLPYVLMPTAPVFFIGAGVFLDQLCRTPWTVGPKWLIPAIVTTIIATAAAPTLISQYRDGRRYDFRGVAHWLDGNLAPKDIVFSDQPRVLAHYLPGTQVHPLRADTTGLLRSIRLLRADGYRGAVWMIPPAPSHAFRTNSKLSVLNRWIFDHCQVRNSIGIARVDFRQHFLQIYRCPPPAT